eukprot:COSAG02_NODE_1054_length_14930_cov_2157.848291_6_plen_153_part_00
MHSACRTGKFPYTTLRPPSVIGPACDNRHERLQRLAMGLPPLDPRGGRKFAAVRSGFRVAYSEDMATAVVATLATGGPAINEAFNIAMDEIVTVEDYLAGVKRALEASGCPYVHPFSPLLGCLPKHRALCSAISFVYGARVQHDCDTRGGCF